MIKKIVTATIISIGDELLIGQVVDTNSAYISRQLSKAGIKVARHIAIADDESDIIRTLDSEIAKVNIIITTGGLGPTSDDTTKQTLSRYFKSSLKVNDAALQNVKRLYKKVYKKNITPVNIAQADVPENCEVIINKRGSAPCMIFEKNKTYVISMAGVPYEMEGIIKDVIPWLRQRLQLPKVLHHTIVTTGIGESDLAAKINGFESQLPKNIKLAYLPGLGMLRLRLSSVAFSKDHENDFKKQFAALKKEVKPYLLSANDISPEITLGRILKAKGMTISTAESCTGGGIASMITSVSGSSAYFYGGIVSYSNMVKERELGVKKTTLKKFGAVSEQVVIEMLKGVTKKMKTDTGISVSGIMGPGGGSAEKPVGTVWIAVGNRKKQMTKKLQLRFNRQKNTEGTTRMALYLMIKFLEELILPKSDQ